VAIDLAGGQLFLRYFLARSFCLNGLKPETLIGLAGDNLRRLMSQFHTETPWIDRPGVMQHYAH
jgi:hypothetical protein